MKKIFLPKLKSNLTKDEQMFIGSWTDNRYFVIQSIIAKSFQNLSETEKQYSDKANTLLNMFSKYKSHLPKDKPVFRGLKFHKNRSDEVLRYRYIVEEIKVAYKFQENYIHSYTPFSTSKKLGVAMDFANRQLEDFYSVVLFFNKRISDELDLTQFSSADEFEVLIQGGLKYKITEYANILNKVYVTLEEIK